MEAPAPTLQGGTHTQVSLGSELGSAGAVDGGRPVLDNTTPFCGHSHFCFAVASGEGLQVA